MERVEYNIDESRIGISIKYPTEINRKWSESYINLRCEECGSTDIQSEKRVDMLSIDCQDCENSWEGAIKKVLTWHQTEEALAKTHYVDGDGRHSIGFESQKE